MPIDPDLPTISNPDQWTDAEIIHFLESSGTCSQVAMAIHGLGIDYEDAEWNDWRKPGYENIRRAVADAYLYGIYIHSGSCKRWHKHCRDL